jgi:hypothetical protein
VQARRSQKKNEVLTVDLKNSQQGDRGLLRTRRAEPSPPEPRSSRQSSRRQKIRRLDAPARDVTAFPSLEPKAADQKRRQPTPGEWMRAARLAQGLPPVVTDPLVLHNIRTIMRAGLENPVAEIILLNPRPARLTRRLDSTTTTSSRTSKQPHSDRPPGDVAL